MERNNPIPATITFRYPCSWTTFQDDAMKDYSLRVGKCFVRSKLNKIDDKAKLKSHDFASSGVGYSCDGGYGSPLDGTYNSSLPLPTSAIALSSITTILDSFRGRRVAFFGDSTMRQQFAHFACMINPDHDISGSFEGNAYSRAVPFRKNGTTDDLNFVVISYLCASCGVKVKVKRKVKLERLNFTHTMSEALLNNDIVLFNVGLWHNMESMKDIEYENNTRLNEHNRANFKDTIMTHVTDAFRECERLLVVGNEDKAEKNRTIGKLIWRESTPQNFATSTGLWPHGKHANRLKDTRCERLTDAKMAINGTTRFNETIYFYNFRNEIVNRYIDHYHPGFCVSRVFYPLSTANFNIHEGRFVGDCTHLNGKALLYTNMNWILMSAGLCDGVHKA